MATALDSLKAVTTVVADTANFEAIDVYKPQDGTTNPTLLFNAVNMPQYSEVVRGAVQKGYAKGGTEDEQVEAVMDELAVTFGTKILQVVPGRVSTEVDAKLSFDTQRTVAKARQLIDMYEKEGVDRNRVLIKIASTWEGIKAGEILEREGIHCNLTLLFGFPQAVACAEAGITLISPFVGRIMDYYKKQTGREYVGAEDPGVQSVKRIYEYFKKYGYDTIVMGASFRNSGEIAELAGVDYLTISPPLLEELQNTPGGLQQKLSVETAKAQCKDAKLNLDEKTFRFMLDEDEMATEKLAEGIRNFSKDTRKLEETVRELLRTR